MELPDFFDGLENCADGEAVWQLILRHCHDLGFNLVSYLHFDMSADGMSRSTRLFEDGFPSDFVRAYTEHQLSLVDPLPIAAMISEMPFRWSKTAERINMSEANTQYMEDTFGDWSRDGLAVQVFGPLMRNGYLALGFGADQDELAPADIRILQACLQAAHLSYCNLVPRDMTDIKSLSARESEVMQLVASGHSNAEIALQLDVSRHTIDTLLRRVFGKLNVKDRTAATIKGITAGLMTPPRKSIERPASD